MSIEKYGDIYTPVCDVCGEELDGEFDFYDAVDAAKREGWKARKNKYDEWEDVCCDCRKMEK